MATISLLHPTRSRPNKSLSTCQKWLERSGHDVELIVSIDSDDPDKELYYRLFSSSWLLNPNTEPSKKVIQNNNRSAVDAINRAAEVCTGDIMIVVSDDTDCNIGWDQEVLKAVDGKEDYLLRVEDGIQKWICTAPIMDRKYYNRFGYVYYPEYRHQFCDTEITHVAQLLGRLIRAPHIMFRHLHYCKGLSDRDALYIRSDATTNQGMEVYLRRFKECFGLAGYNPWILPPEAEGHIQWLKNKLG